jgi:GAF domain-containing protein
MRATRLNSIRAQLLLGFSLILGLALVSAVIGYVSLQSVQRVTTVNLQQANALRERSQKLENEFLLARQNESAFFERWREIGVDAAVAEYAAPNQAQIESARRELDGMRELVAADPQLTAEIGDAIDRLQPLLDYYAEVFTETVDNITAQGETAGLERSLQQQFTALEQSLADEPDIRYYQLLLRIQANQQAFFGSGRQEYVDRTRLLTSELNQALAEDEGRLFNGVPGWQLTPRLQAHLAVFLQLVALERITAVNQAIFREITAEINQLTAVVNAVGERGVLDARQQLTAVNQQSSLALLITAFLTLGFSLLVAAILSRRIINPLNQLNVAAEAIGAGALTQPAVIGGSREMAALGGAFNEMNRRLNELIGSLERRVADRTRDLALAGEVGRSLGAVRDVDELLNDAVGLIQHRFELYQTQVYLADESRRLLVLRAGAGRATAVLLDQRHRLPIGPGSINGVAAADRQPVLVSDTADNALFRPNPLLPDTRSELAVPLLAGDRLLGVLDLQSATPAAFREENLTAFELLAGQLATAIENANLFTEINRAQEAIAAQTRLLTRAGWHEFLDAVDQSEFIGYSYDQNGVKPLTAPPAPGETAAPILVAGEPVGRLELDGAADLDEGLLTAVADQVARQIENLRLLAQAERFRAVAEAAQSRLRREGWQLFRETRTMATGFIYDQNQVQPLSGANGYGRPRLVQPILLQGETLGEIGILDDQPVDEETTQLLAAVSERLAAHLESLRLTGQTEEALAESDLLYQASAQLNRANNYSEILEVVRQYTVAGDQSHTIGLAIFDRQWTPDQPPRNFRFMASWGAAPETRLAGQYPLTDFPTADQILQRQTPTVIPDIYADDRFDDNLRLIYGQRLQARSVLFAPLLVGDRWSGFINAVYTHPREFSDAEVRQLATLTGQAAVAIQNLRNLDLAERRAQEALQRSEELAALNRVVAQLAASFNMYELMDMVAQELIALFDLEHVGIALLDDGQETLTVVSDSGRQPGEESAVGIVLPVKGNLSTERVLATKRPLIIDDAQNNPFTAPIHDLLRWRGTETLVIMPLLSGAELIGTIGMDIAVKDRLFSDEELRLAETVVAQISSTVQNVRLFEQTQTALGQTETLYRISAELNAAQSYDDVLATMQRGGQPGANAHYLSLALFDRPWTQGDELDKGATIIEAARLTTADIEFLPVRPPLPASFWQTGQTLFIADLSADAELSVDLRQEYEKSYKAGALLVEPLLVGASWIGYLLALYPQPQTFVQTERQQFRAVVGQAAVALQNLRNIELTQQRSVQVEWLATIQSSLSQAVTEEEIVSAISLFADLDQPPDMIMLEYIHLNEANEPERLQLMTRWRDGLIQPDDPLLGQQRHVSESGLSKFWLDLTVNEALMIEDMAVESRLDAATRRRADLLQIGALALLPLRSGNRWQAVVTVSWGQTHPFSRDEQFYLQQMLEPLTAIVAERRAYLAQQEALAETELLYQATTEFNLSLTYDDILATLRRHTIIGENEASAGLALFDHTWTPERPAEWVDAVALWSRDDITGTPRRFLVRDYPSADLFLRSDSPIFVEDIDKIELDKKARGLFKRIYQARAAVFVPLVAGGRWIGYITAFFREVRDFSPAQRRRLFTMANQAAVAAQNTRLIEQTRLRADELLVLNEMGRDLTQIQAVDEVLDTVHNHISRLMEATDSYIALYNEELDEVEFRIYGEGEGITTLRRRATNGITEHVLRSKKPLLIRENLRETAEKLGIMLAGRDSASWLGVPMFLGAKPIGVLTVQSFSKSRLYDEHHQELLTAFASQTAIAVENIRLLEQTRERATELTVLNEMGRDLSETLDVQTIVESAYQYSSQLLDTTNFYIALYEPEREWLEFSLATEGGARKRWAGRTMGQGLTEYIIRSRRPLLIAEDVNGWLAANGLASIGTPAQSWMGVPMLYGDEMIGVIALQSFDAAHHFNAHHMELLSAISGQTASALSNARLFEQVQARARREQILRQITAEVRRAVDMDTIMRTAVQELGQALGRRAIIHLGQDVQPFVTEQETGHE